MHFIEPALLWGALAVAIPIAIHFWHQQRAKPLPWAATRWLTEAMQQQSRGVRLDDWWLLLVRCILLLLLTLLLAQLLTNWVVSIPVRTKIHLVEPNPAVTNTFRFELEAARQRGEPVYSLSPFTPLTLQTAINQRQADQTELNLYLTTNQALASVPAITVPPQYRLHTVVDSANSPRPFLVTIKGQKLFVNHLGHLTTQPDPASSLRSEPAIAGPITVWLDDADAAERHTIRAALNALAEVYALNLSIDEKPVANRVYAWVFTNQLPAKRLPQTLYMVLGSDSALANQATTDRNILFTQERLTPQSSERVATGQLPAWLGEHFIRFIGGSPGLQPLTQSELTRLFVVTPLPNRWQQAGLQNGLLLLFIGLLCLERWLALTKNR